MMVHPMYRKMHSYPYQRDQVHYSPHFYPGTEPAPDQMYSNPIRPPISYGPYGYAPPISCYGCCNHHTYMPAHYPNWGSPYSHHIPPPPHCPVSYPSFPAQYMPCCPMGQPRYEFEKNVPTMHGQHCCGCPNNQSHPIKPGRMRIDEEEPGSVAPLQLKNEHSPIVWMPPDNNGNMKEQRKDNDEGNNNNQVVWKEGAKNGWYPLDLNNLVSMKKESGDKERKHQHGDDDESEGRHCPLPLFWIPYKPEEKEKEMEKHNLGNLNTKPSLDPEMSSPGEKKIQMKEESSKNREGESDMSVKDGIIGEKKLPKECVKRKNPSPPKSSKLPPVCLRVDPLPRRKTANGSSQSDEAKTKVTNSLDDKKVRNIVPTNEVKEGKGTKTIQVVDGKTLQENSKHVNVEAPFDQPKGKPEKENSTRECIENDAMEGCQSEEIVSAMGKNEEGTKVTNKRKFSEEEAAVIIQSVYRGFDTRRWDPVKKLKEIAGVRDQVYSVKHMIQAMESCSDIEGSSKQRNVISETIMRLLLKLDTIQGLHPSIREVRKSVVKELVSLQEKLDSVMIEKLNSPQHELNLGCEEDASNKIEDATVSKNGHEVLSDLSEAGQNQPEGALCENSEISEASEVLIDKLEKEDEKSNERLESDEISDREYLLVEQSSEVLPDSSMKEADQNQHIGAFICENSEMSEANEVLMDKLEKEDEKSNDGLESDEVSDNRENLVDEQSSEVPILPDSSMKEADQDKPEGAFICENSEIPEADEVSMDKLEKEDEKCNVGLESGEISDRENLMVEQSSEVPTLTDSSLQVVDFAPSDRDKCDSELALLPQGDLDNLHAQEKKTCQVDEGPVTLESQNDEIDNLLEADIKTCHDDKLEHEERIEAKSDMGVSDANDSIISEKEVSGDQLLHESNLERDMAEEANTAVKEPENAAIEENANGDEKIGARETNVEPEKGVVDLTERNKKLIEENEKLRGIMENLIKSGQEQLTAISSLTGRVKDLERKLCKKKKLKVKKGKGRKMRGLVHE